MLIRKVEFLWMGIISIFVLGFGVLPAMAAEFGVSLDMSDDVSHAEGLQLERAATITLTIEFEQAVVLGVADVSVSQYDEDGGFLGSAVPVISPTTAAQVFTLTITPADDAARLAVRTRQGIAAADPFSEGTSAEGNWGVGLVSENPPDGPDGTNPPGGPDVLRIALVGEPFEIITTATFQIHVLLSEEPRGGFNKGLLEVKDATVRSVVKLASPGSSTTVNGATVRATWRDNMLHLYLVTLEIQPGEKTVEIKVKNFVGMETPSGALFQETYVREPDTDLVEGKDILTVKTHSDIPVIPPDRVSIIPSSRGSSTPVNTDATPTPEKQNADTADTTATEKVETDADDMSVSIPMAGRIYISEIMFAGGGSLPQWIEISNGSRTEQVNLSGWIVQIENMDADADAVTVTKFKIPGGTRIDPSGQHETPSTILVISKQGRNNLEGAMAEGQVVKQDRQWSLSDMAFRITLAPPSRVIFTDEQAAARAAVTDVVGNLTEDSTVAWALPMHEGGGRSSILRRHVPGSMDAAEPKDGVMMESWVLASDTGFTQGMHVATQSYYGLPTDIGTPGFRAGGALPVELSHFRPARDKATGAVVITWSTQSELNNAGFFIKRSNQKNGEFRVINATMVPGAGTTSEKQFYTFTDTTAQPNVVYYYQIEDISLDGNRQTLTNGIRLRGHIGAAGKLTTSWGELKSIQ